MALHFTKEELAGRRQRACQEMARQGLDGLLIFRQESMYYLTGYDTSGYSGIGPDDIRERAAGLAAHRQLWHGCSVSRWRPLGTVA